MTGRLAVAAFSAVLIALAVVTPAPAQTNTAATVTRVVDGDTVRARVPTGGEIVVRLIGVDAPEAVPRECGTDEATEALRALVEGRAVVLVSDPTQGDFDRFGRTLAYVEVAGVDAGKQLILAGRAGVFQTTPPFQRASDYAAAQTSAYRASAGAWRDCGGNFHRAVVESTEESISAPGPSPEDSAERFVRRYYFLLNERRFGDAWEMLSSGFRRRLGSYPGWRAGYSRMLGTKVNQVSVALAGGKAAVRIAIRATDTDACNGRSVKRFFRGRWVLARRAGWWIATGVQMRKVGGGQIRLSKSECRPKRPSRRPARSPAPSPPSGGSSGGSGCHPSYSPCVPTGRDYNCPELNGPYRVIGPDEYRLDGDGDGVGCE